MRYAQSSQCISEKVCVCVVFVYMSFKVYACYIYVCVPVCVACVQLAHMRPMRYPLRALMRIASLLVVFNKPPLAGGKGVVDTHEKDTKGVWLLWLC